MDAEQNSFIRFIKKVFYILDTPVELFREKVVVPNQKKYPWYHQNFRRVPTIDECHELDAGCRFEAQQQFKRDKMVDEEIVAILRNRYEDCAWYYSEDRDTQCKDLYNSYTDATTAYAIKYADLSEPLSVVEAFMKQKHRMIWERRHGPVGSGITNKKYDVY